MRSRTKSNAAFGDASALNRRMPRAAENDELAGGEVEEQTRDRARGDPEDRHSRNLGDKRNQRGVDRVVGGAAHGIRRQERKPLPEGRAAVEEGEAPVYRPGESGGHEPRDQAA